MKYTESLGICLSNNVSLVRDQGQKALETLFYTRRRYSTTCHLNWLPDISYPDLIVRGRFVS